MKINSLKSSSGFTVVEVLIVLGIMGFLMYIAINYIGGNTQKANFTVAINGFKQKIEQVISETANGFYPNNNDFSCDGSTSPPTINSGSGTSQGTNLGCIFLGKAVLMNQSSGQFSVIPIVGNEFYNQQSSQTIYGSSPANPTLTINSSNNYSVATQTLDDGLTFQYVHYNGTSSSTAAFALVAGDSTGNIATTNGGNLNSGPEPLSLYYDSQSIPLGGTDITHLNNDVKTVNGLLAASEIDICATTGSQSGLIKIGGAGSLNVSIYVYNDGTC